MYTNNYNSDYEYDDYQTAGEENTHFSNNRGLIIKIIIIILCVILLIWLISALKGKNNEVVYNPQTHDENVTSVRLAAEKYFFIDKNMPANDEVKVVTIKTLKDKNLISEVVDSNAKVCNDTKSIATLSKDSSYVLKIKLSCSTKEEEEIFFYDVNDYSCVNCNGKTNMEKTHAEEEEKYVEPEINYSCKDWSEWTSTRVNDPSLIERTRTLVKGVKYGETEEVKEYSDWSEWQETPIEDQDGLEVEQEVKTEQKWSKDKQTTNPITNSDTIKVTSTSTVGGGTYTYCASGYKKNGNICISNETYTSDLTYAQYNSYYITNKPCNDVRTIKNSDGKYVLVYKGCSYKKTDSIKTGRNSGYTVYTYQEMEDVDVTYYRSRSYEIKEEKTEDLYTEDYYEETNLPQGYVKLVGSEKIEYSYKVSQCEK